MWFCVVKIVGGWCTYGMGFLPLREGGGGAPTFFVRWFLWGVLKKVEREPETDPLGTVGLGCSGGVTLRGTPRYCFFLFF